jgi:hypothetical protein
VCQGAHATCGVDGRSDDRRVLTRRGTDGQSREEIWLVRARHHRMVVPIHDDRGWTEGVGLLVSAFPGVLIALRRPLVEFAKPGLQVDRAAKKTYWAVESEAKRFCLEFGAQRENGRCIEAKQDGACGRRSETLRCVAELGAIGHERKDQDYQEEDRQRT